MKQFVVIKDVLNIRNKPDAESDGTFVGELRRGTVVFLDEREIAGTVPPGATSNLWLADTLNRVVHKEGVVEAAQFWNKVFGIEQLWEHTKGEGVNVVLIDSGIRDCDDLHTDGMFKTTAPPGGDPTDKLGHGTYMASIIAGSGAFIQGVAPNAKLHSIKFTDSKEFDEGNFKEALKILPGILKKDQFYIINCSLNLRFDLEDAKKTEILQIIKMIRSEFDAVFIAAVGNDGKKEDKQTAPACLDGVISCAAFRASELGGFVRLTRSNYWPSIVITAPGDFPAGQISGSLRNQGSSQACAFTTGLTVLFVSKLLKADKRLQARNVIDAIRMCTTKVEGNLTYNILDKDKMIQTFEKF